MQRHPLHTISQLIHYTDGFGKPNIALKIGQVGKTVFNCYVFQCHTEVCLWPFWIVFCALSFLG